MNPDPILAVNAVLSTGNIISPLPLQPRSPRGPQLIVKGQRVIEVRTPSGHPPAVVVRAGDVE